MVSGMEQVHLELVELGPVGGAGVQLVELRFVIGANPQLVMENVQLVEQVILDGSPGVKVMD